MKKVELYNKLKKNYKNKYWWKKQIKNYTLGLIFRLKNNGTYIMQEDWDNLLILDACRYDTFMEVTGEKPSYIISRGSTTKEFIEENFLYSKYNDTIYITANPWVNKICKDRFYKVVSVWKHEWNKKFDTVLPKTVVDYALKIEEKYPNKRLIIHFMQPHEPYIKDSDLVKASGNPGLEMRRGNMNIDRVYKAYKRNLETVVPHAFYLAKRLRGKSVITSDHGEGFGDKISTIIPYSVFGHPGHIHVSTLVKVPWLVFNSGERKEIKVRDEREKLSSNIKKQF